MLQSTLPHGERRWISQFRAVRCDASIHAPARGATILRVFAVLVNQLQSTLPHGERHPRHLVVQALRRFNPRSRTGSDTAAVVCAIAASSFNPRSRTGSDRPWPSATTTVQKASIHAPARGATRRRSLCHCCLQLQSTLQHGERPLTCSPRWTVIRLQSTLPHGERPHRRV